MGNFTKAVNKIQSTLKKSRVYESFDEASNLRAGDKIKHAGSWRGEVIKDKHKAYLEQWGPMPDPVKKKLS